MDECAIDSPLPALGCCLPTATSTRDPGPETRLDDHLRSLTDTGMLPDSDELARIGRALAALLDTAASEGIAVTELTLADFFLDDRGRVRLAPVPALPEPGRSPTSTEVVRALGGLLHLLATGVPPRPDLADRLAVARRMRVLNPEIGAAIIAVMARCLAPGPGDRIERAAHLGSALREAARADRRGAAAPFLLPDDTEAVARHNARRAARHIGDLICATSGELPHDNGRHRHVPEDGIAARAADAGVVLALARLVEVLGDPTHRAVLAAAARRLRDAPHGQAEASPGLLTGEGAVCVALLAAGQTLHDKATVAAAADLGRWLATRPYRAPGLVNGSAGRVRLHLGLFTHTGDLSHLEDAVDAGGVLLASAIPLRDGIAWRTAARDETIEPGYARGVAGIADALLDLSEVTGDTRFLAAARDAAAWLASEARPLLADGSGIGWPARAGEAARAAGWHDGAPGIVHFFARAATFALVPHAWDIAVGAARTAATAGRWAGPSLATGLAGNIESLLDIYQATDDRHWLGLAREHARLLDERLAGASERPGDYSLAYLDGYAGIVSALVRLAEPDRVPHQLGLRAVQRHPTPSRPGGLKDSEITV